MAGKHVGNEVTTTEARLRQQQQALLEIARQQGHDGVTQEEFFRAIAEKAAETLDVERVSIWLYSEDRAEIHCHDLFESSKNRHSGGMVLRAVDFPDYFGTLEKNRVLAADDAHTHPNTKAFSDNYLTPLGVEAMLDAPIRRGGEIIGVICSEHIGSARRWLLDEQNFVASVGDMVSLWLELEEHRAVEARLQESERWLATLVDTIPYGIQENDIHGVITFSNTAHQRILGYSERELIGKHIWDMHLTADDKAKLKAYLNTLLVEQPVPTSYISRNQRKDGGIIEIQVDWDYKRDAQGKVIGFISVITDITERRKAEERLRQSAALFESTAEGVIITDTAGNICAVNKAFTTITGYSEAEVFGKNPRVIKSDKHDESFYATLWASLKQVGNWQGEIWDRRKNGEVFPAWTSISSVYGDDGQVTHYVSVFSDSTSIRRSQEQIDHLAHYDPMTDLPNRLLFRDRLSHALTRASRENRNVAVVCLDLDNFKHINDSLGHPVGDRLLQDVAHRLLDLVRVEDTVARLGGDEFTILMEEVDEAQDAAVLAQKVLESFRQPVELDGQELRITASIGISVFPRDGGDVDTLIKNADAAMHRAKNERNDFQFYTKELSTLAFERVLLETSLRRALEKNEFLLYYQPQLFLKTGRIVGAEALIRWQHPDMGLVPPDKFIPLAEDSGLIVPLGEWVIHTACAQMRRWQEAGYPIQRIAVNVSGVQFQRANLVETVKLALKKSGLRPQALELEITESFIMQKTDWAIGVLRDLKALGVSMAIDDFGTGYSSLSYLKRLPVDKLKIDRSFVRDIPDDPNDEAITRAIIALGQSLHLGVIAEGVETKEQEVFLKSLACDEVQGFLYSRPLPADDFVALLERESG